MHRLLLRQLNRFFGPADAVPAHLRNFINAVDEAYEQNDAEQKHLQHSYEQAAKDLAERNRQVALRTRELDMLKQAAVDAIIVADFEAKIVDANPAAQAALGRTIHELRGQVIYDTIVPEAHRDAHSQLIARHLSGHETGVSRIETRCIRPGSGEFPVEMAVTVVRGEGPSQIIVCFRDISSKKGTAAPAPAAPAPQAAPVVPDAITRLAAQLREPLADMKSNLDQLEDTSLSGQQRHFVEGLHTAAGSITSVLTHIVEQIPAEGERDHEHAEAGGETSEFDLARTIEDIVDTAAPAAGQKGLEFAYSINPDVPTAVVGDPLCFRQVLINLVSNAIKFTDHGEVVVHVSASDQTDSHVMVRCAVKDSGRGIPEEQVDKLYKQLSEPTSGWTHGGRGLAMSRQLVAAMGGTIGIESQPGQGSTFWFTAKLRKQHIHSSREDGPMLRPTDGLRVLVVDDNATNCTVMKEQLEGWGMSVETAPGGSEALKILLDGVVANKPFDVAVVDYEMPGMDGIELGRTIRAIPTFRRMPMVLLRPSTAMVNDTLMWDGGFSLCLVKPLRPTQLKDAIEHCMSGHAVPGNNSARYEQELSQRPEIDEKKEATPPPPGPMKLEMVIQRCMGDLQYLQRVLYQFQEQSNETLDRITERLNARDGEGAARLASALKGAAEYMGADDLRDHAAHIEELAKLGVLNETLKAMGDLREEVFRCIDYIPELLHQAATRKEAA